MKKLIFTFAWLFSSLILSAQNPWINCNGVEALTQKWPKTMNASSGFTFGNDTAMGFNSGNTTDTCMLLKMNSKCHGLDSSEGVLMCFDHTGKVTYTVIKLLSSANGLGWDGVKASVFDLANGTMLLGNNPTNPNQNIVYHKKIGDTIYLSNDAEYFSNFNNFSEYNNLQLPLMTSTPFAIKCDTCVERMIGIMIGEKVGLPVGTPCIVHCSPLTATTPVPAVPLATVSVYGNGSGNGILTYNWSFNGSSIGGGSPICPDIDMGRLGGGTICLTITNTLPDGTSCQCVECVGMCFNVVQPNKSAGSFLSSEIKLNIYPTPISNNKLSISADALTDNSDMTIDIYTITGIKMKTSHHVLKKGSNQLSIDMKELARGNYILNADIAGSKFSKRILLE